MLTEVGHATNKKKIVSIQFTEEIVDQGGREIGATLGSFHTHLRGILLDAPSLGCWRKGGEPQR